MAENIEKMTEATKSKKIRFNVVDVIIIVVVVACIIGIVLRFALTKTYQDQNFGEYWVTFQAEGLSYSQLIGIEQALDEGTTGGNFVSFAAKNEGIGNLYAITDSELLYIESHNGDRINFEIGENEVKTVGSDDSWKDASVWYIKGTIICKGEYASDKSFMLNGTTYIASNSTIDVTTKYSEFTLKILNIEEHK